MQPSDAVALLSADPSQTALLCDFDGTLAPIVAEPSAARPCAGAGAALDALSGRYARVAVISGRPLAFLEPLLPLTIDIGALYGLQRRSSGVRWEHPEAPAWRRVVASVAQRASRDLVSAGVVVEDKGLSLTLHTRRAPQGHEQAAAWAGAVAAKTGLEARAAKASIELHPPLPIDKGTLVTEWSAGASTIAYAGDDLGDLAAFAALDQLATDRTRTTVRIAVDGPEAPAPLIDAADVVLANPAALVELLQRLVAAN